MFLVGLIIGIVIGILVGWFLLRTPDLLALIAIALVTLVVMAMGSELDGP